MNIVISMIINEQYFNDEITSTDNITTDIELQRSLNKINPLEINNTQYPYNIVVNILYSDNKTTIQNEIISGAVDKLYSYIKHSIDACNYITDYSEPVSCVMFSLMNMYKPDEYILHNNNNSTLALYYNDKDYNYTTHIRHLYIIRCNANIKNVKRLCKVIDYILKPFINKDIIVSTSINCNIDDPLMINVAPELSYNYKIEPNKSISLFEISRPLYISQIANKCNITGKTWYEATKCCNMNFHNVQRYVINSYIKDKWHNMHSIEKTPMCVINNYEFDDDMLNYTVCRALVYSLPILEYCRNTSFAYGEVQDYLNDGEHHNLTVWKAFTTDLEENTEDDGYYIWIDNTIMYESAEYCIFFRITPPGKAIPSQTEQDEYNEFRELIENYKKWDE